MPGGSEMSERAPDDRRRPELITTSLQQILLPAMAARWSPFPIAAVTMSLLPATVDVSAAVVETPAAKTSVGFTHMERAGSVVKSAKRFKLDDPISDS